MGNITGLDRHQLFLAPSLEDSVSADNPVRVIDALVEVMDLEQLGFVNAVPSVMGRPSYSARDLLKLYLYGYLQGVRSSRRLEAELYRNTEVVWLLRGLRPDHKTVAEFRRKNPKPLQKVFREFVSMLDGWDLLGKELFAVDGSKIRASNNKKRNFSKKKLEDRLKRIDEKIDGYMKELDVNDKNEDATPAINVQATLESLNKRKQEYEEHVKKLEESGQNEVSLTDPDSRLMGNNRGGVEVSYNVQSGVDAKHSLVVEVNVTNNPSDHGQLSVMSKRIKKRLKIKDSFTVLADKGYYNGPDLKRCKKYKIRAIVARQKAGRDAPDTAYNADKFTYDERKDCYICPAGQVLKRTGTKESRLYQNKKVCANCTNKAKCTTGSSKRISVSHYQKIFSDTDRLLAENMGLYKRRQMIVEHPLGTIKHNMNAHYFLLRTIKKVRGEVALLFLAYNLKRALSVLGFEGLMERLKALSIVFFHLFGQQAGSCHITVSECRPRTAF